MAKRALINRDEKRRKLVEKFAAKRESLFAVVNDQARTEEERFAARLEIDRKSTRLNSSHT